MAANLKVSQLALVFLSILVLVLGQTREPEPEKLTSNPCKLKTHCGDCIAADPQCAWCSKENFTGEGKTRCDIMVSLQQSQCGSSNIVFPANKVERTKSKPLSKGGGVVEDVVQLAPQEVRLKLRPKDPYKLEVNFC